MLNALQNFNFFKEKANRSGYSPFGSRFANDLRISFQGQVCQPYHSTAPLRISIGSPLSGFLRKQWDGMLYITSNGANDIMVIDDNSGLSVVATGFGVNTSNSIDAHPYRVGLSNNSGIARRTVGKKNYKLSDHLGTIRAVVSDAKQRSGEIGDNMGEYDFDAVAINDYHIFEMVMLEIDFQSEGYGYGFGGVEKDDEVKEVATLLTLEQGCIALVYGVG